MLSSAESLHEVGVDCYSRSQQSDEEAAKHCAEFSPLVFSRS